MPHSDESKTDEPVLAACPLPAEAERDVARTTSAERKVQVETLEQDIMLLSGQLTARRLHQSKLYEAARKLYQRFGTDDADVMDVWSLAIIDPEPPTPQEIRWAQQHFPRTNSPSADASELAERLRVWVKHEWSLREFSDLTADQGQAILEHADRIVRVLAAHPSPPPAEARDLHDAFVEGWTAAGYMESALSVEECWDQSQTKRAPGRAPGRPEGPTR